MGGRKQLTYAQHQELGPRLKEARKLLMDAQLRICNGLGTSSKPCRAITRMLDILDLRVKHELDEVIFRDFPEKETQELIRTYYGPTSRDRVVLHRKPSE